MNPNRLGDSKTVYTMQCDGFQWAMVVTAFCIGGLVGANGSGGLIDSLGRKSFIVCLPPQPLLFMRTAAATSATTTTKMH